MKTVLTHLCKLIITELAIGIMSPRTMGGSKKLKRWLHNNDRTPFGVFYPPSAETYHGQFVYQI